MGEAASELISQAAPTFCIHVPIPDAKEAVHTPRKTGCRNGLQAEAALDTSSGEAGDLGGESVPDL